MSSTVKMPSCTKHNYAGVIRFQEEVPHPKVLTITRSRLFIHLLVGVLGDLLLDVVQLDEKTVLKAMGKELETRFSACNEILSKSFPTKVKELPFQTSSCAKQRPSSTSQRPSSILYPFEGEEEEKVRRSRRRRLGTNAGIESIGPSLSMGGKPSGRAASRKLSLPLRRPRSHKISLHRRQAAKPTTRSQRNEMGFIDRDERGVEPRRTKFVHRAFGSGI